MESKRERDEQEPLEESAAKRTKQDDSGDEKEEGGSASKLKKRKVALLLAYMGTNYQGMQINPDCNSIELNLHKAIHKAGGISDQNMESLQKIGWMRASRTDKGVHAARQIINLKMLEVPDVVQKINENLNDDIRVFAYCRVANSFNSKTFCDARRYEYLVPTWVFEKAPVRPPRGTTTATTTTEGQSAEEKTKVESEGQEVSAETSTTSGEPAVATEATAAALEKAITEELEQEEKEEKEDDARPTTGKYYQDGSERVEVTPEEIAQCYASGYRLTAEDRAKINRLLSAYVGTHTFQNFTLSHPFAEKSSFRFIKSFECGEPFVVDGQEYVVLTVIGQSFMLHQIRKMVGMVIALARGLISEDILPKALTNQYIVNVPMAPGLGLLLDELYFNGYNQRYGKTHQTLTFEHANDKVEEFKQKIYKHIAEQEMALNTVARWTVATDYHAPKTCSPKLIPAAMKLAKKKTVVNDE